MIKKLLIISIVIILLCSMITISDNENSKNIGNINSIEEENWYIETLDGGGYGNSIALDCNGYPHISYYKSFNGTAGIKYAYWDGSEWNMEIVDVFNISGGINSIALDSNGFPHICYVNGIRGLQYAHWNGTDWNIEIIDGTAYSSNFNSIAVDSNDHPHISYFHFQDEDLKYAHWNGTNWNIEIVDGYGPSSVGDRNSIALDSNDLPHISYFDDISNDLKYAHWNGTNWNIEVLEHVGEFAYCSSIAIDSNDHPHISYLTIFRSKELKYAYYNGTNWTKTIITDYNVFGPNSIALDSNDYPHISYSTFDNVHIGGINYAYWDGTNWTIEIINVNHHYYVHENSIAVDSNDNPHIRYYNNYNNELLYAKKMSNQPPVADFDYTPIIPDIYQTIIFTDISYDPVGSIVDWHWDFGDSETSIEQYPSHNYSTNGIYTVELTVTDNDGVSDTHSKIIPVGLDLYYLQDLYSGWNFISLPFNESIDKNDLLLKHGSYFYDIGYLFGWNRLIQSYEFSYVLYPGYGYWLYSNDDDELWIIDIHTDYDSYITTVEEGWNIMGVPYYNLVDKTDVLVDGESWDTAVSNSWISDYMFDWYETGQSYVFSDTFMPTEAYWLYAYQNCILKRNN